MRDEESRPATGGELQGQNPPPRLRLRLLHFLRQGIVPIALSVTSDVQLGRFDHRGAAARRRLSRKAASWLLSPAATLPAEGMWGDGGGVGGGAEGWVGGGRSQQPTAAARTSCLGEPHHWLSFSATLPDGKKKNQAVLMRNLHFESVARKLCFLQFPLQVLQSGVGKNSVQST